MNHPPFQVVPLQPRSFLQRLFKQQPVENAVIEVNNLLANSPIEQLSRPMVMKIGVQYHVDINKTFPLNMEEFYATYLNFILRKHQLGYFDEKNLYLLQDILGLKDTVIQHLHISIGSIWYEKAIRKCIKNGIFSQQEEKALSGYSRHLRLPAYIADKIKEKLL